MKLPAGRRNASERGSFLVESALTLSLFLTVIFGLIDVGRAVWVHNAIAHLAREGTRYAMVRGSSNPTPATAAQIKKRIVDHSFAINTAALGVASSWPDGNRPGKSVTVEVTYDFEPYMPFVPARTIAMRSRSTMTISR